MQHLRKLLKEKEYRGLRQHKRIFLQLDIRNNENVFVLTYVAAKNGINLTLTGSYFQTKLMLL
jgi:hypothetical protein